MITEKKETKSRISKEVMGNTYNSVVNVTANELGKVIKNTMITSDVVDSVVHESLSFEDIQRNYKDTAVYKMLEEGRLIVDSPSIFKLVFDRSYALPTKENFFINEITGFDSIGIQYVEGNRLLSRRYVKQLAQSMETYGVRLATCIMDVEGRIYEGQSRIAAAMSMGGFVYVVIDAHPIEDMVICLNAQSNAWKSDDKIYSYKESGNENYQRLYDIMHLFDADKAHKEANATRNFVCNVVQDNLWGGQLMKSLIDSGDFKISEEVYLEVKNYLQDIFAPTIVHLNECRERCVEQLKMQGISAPRSKKFARPDYLQISFYHMRNVVNANGERLGDDLNRFKAFLNSLNIEPIVSNGTAYGLCIASTASAAKDSNFDLFRELLHLFDKWNENWYYPQKHKKNEPSYDYNTMSFYKAFVENEKAKKETEAKKAKKAKVSKKTKKG